MDLLEIKHQDFRMFIECTKFEGVWHKAVNNVGEDNLHSTYSWSDGVEYVRRNGTEELENGKQAKAVFFDNAEYPVWVEFERGVTKAQFGSMLQSENDRFSFRRGVLAGFLNYGNEVGRSEICIAYETDGVAKQFTFAFEVLSTKLNYHEHWRQIIADIEQEYRMLSLDYMKRTFHGFTPDAEGDTQDIVWWSIFKNEQEKFERACRSIIKRPRHRLRGYQTYQRADKLKRITPGIENELAEHRYEPAHLYVVEEQLASNDTQENRFLKFALDQILTKFLRLKSRIEGVQNIAQGEKERLDKIATSMTRLQRNPFFRTVGRFKGLNQESLVLQKASGYSQVFRTWQMLRRAYSLYDGMYRMQTKDIATLYEIWCFIAVSHIVKEQMRINDDDVDHRNRMEMNGLFSYELGKGEHSRILFRKDGVELAELVYNPKHTERENDNISMEHIIVPTVAQKPDIVLQLTKNDMQRNMKMTYLFDAKYRIDHKENGVDVPPEDAINQMHRYRDAIYYKDGNAGALKKEVIGGYILFPGDGEPADVEVSKFYKTIEQVNIGAFPLRPKDDRNRQLLKDFIDGLLSKKSSEIVSSVIPQKGMFVEVNSRVLVGLVKNGRQAESFERGEGELYYTGRQFPTTIALHDLHYFAPYIKGKGVRDVYEITKVRTITSRDAKDGDDSNDLRLAFHLANRRQLSETYKAVDLNIDYTFCETTFEDLHQLANHSE